MKISKLIIAALLSFGVAAAQNDSEKVEDSTDKEYIDPGDYEDYDEYYDGDGDGDGDGGAYYDKYKEFWENNRRTILYYYGDYEANDFTPTYKEEAIYDVQGRVTENLRFQWDDSTKVWNKNVHYEYRYNDKDEITMYAVATFDFDYEKNHWNGSKTESHRDPDNNNKVTLLIRYDWKPETQEWQTVSKKIDTKDLKAYYQWSDQSQSLIGISKNEHTRDSIYINNAAADIEYTYGKITHQWDSLSNDFLPSKKEIERTVKNSYRLISTYKCDKETADWKKHEQHKDSLYENNRATVRIIYQIDKTLNDWQPYKKDTYTAPYTKYYWDKYASQWQTKEEALHPEAWELLAESLDCKDEDPNKATAQLHRLHEKLISLNADSLDLAQINYYLAQKYYLNSLRYGAADYDKAEQHIQQAIAYYPNDFRFYTTYGNIFFNRKTLNRDLNEALEQYEKSRDTYPQHIHPKENIVFNSPAITHNLAVVHFCLKNYEKSAEYYRTAHEENYRMPQISYVNWITALSVIAVRKSPAERDSIHNYVLKIIHPKVDYNDKLYKNNVSHHISLTRSICYMQQGAEADKTCKKGIELTKNTLQTIGAEDKYHDYYYDCLTAFYARRAELNINGDARKLFKEAITYGKLLASGGKYFYNLSCVYALKGEAKPAFHYLKKALEEGRTTFSYVETDNDWRKMRTHRQYLKLKNKYID
jgi:tetratricopeptide (TPR) repeat protein